MWCSARFGSHYSSSLVWKTLVVTNSHEGDKEVKVANERTLTLKTSCGDRLTAIRERERESTRREGENEKWRGNLYIGVYISAVRLSAIVGHAFSPCSCFCCCQWYSLPLLSAATPGSGSLGHGSSHSLYYGFICIIISKYHSSPVLRS